MADGGWIGKYAFQNNGLAADDVGRAAMEDSYIQTAKIQSGAVTAAKLGSKVLYTGVYNVSQYGSCVYG